MADVKDRRTVHLYPECIACDRRSDRNVVRVVEVVREIQR